MSNNIKIEYRTAESVSPKHPDKLCDQISDAILDAHLREDSNARVAVDVAGGHGTVFVTGEVTSRAQNVNVFDIVKRIAGDVELIEHLAKQSPEIAGGVDTGGAGDQGIMIGYACDETPELLPREVVLARRLNQFLFKKWQFDGKTQVTLRDGEIVAVVASFQNASKKELEKAVKSWLASEPILPLRSIFSYEKSGVKKPVTTGLTNVPKRQFGEASNRCLIFANPAGDWQQGGFDSDAGLTGRKLAVDNYGPRIAVGGGAFSGKDPSKVDRSAAYMARRIAVDYLHERKAHEVFVRLAYAIGVAEPLEKSVIIDGAHEIISEKYDLTPRGIIKFLDLKQPIYEPTARYGHFGEGFNWDK